MISLIDKILIEQPTGVNSSDKFTYWLTNPFISPFNVKVPSSTNTTKKIINNYSLVLSSLAKKFWINFCDIFLNHFYIFPKLLPTFNAFSYWLREKWPPAPDWSAWTDHFLAERACMIWNEMETCLFFDFSLFFHINHIQIRDLKHRFIGADELKISIKTKTNI